MFACSRGAAILFPPERPLFLFGNFGHEVIVAK
jgi:hypothetical protein